jgi:hypothetical protein
MAASEGALKRWNDEFRKPENNTRPDAVERMFRGTPLANSTGDPLRDALFLPAEKAEERERIMAEVDQYEDSATICGIGPDPTVTMNGETFSAYEFVRWQHTMTYELLAKGHDVRSVAVAVHRSPAWVDQVRQDFNL